MSHFRYTANFIQNVRENYNQALVIFKRLKLPLGDRTDTNFTAPRRMLFQSSKSPFDSLKSVFNVYIQEENVVGWGGLYL